MNQLVVFRNVFEWLVLFYLLCMKWEFTSNFNKSFFALSFFFVRKNPFCLPKNGKKMWFFLLLFSQRFLKSYFAIKAHWTVQQKTNILMPIDQTMDLDLIFDWKLYWESENWKVLSENAKVPLSPRIQMQRFRLNQKQWFFDCIFHRNMFECWPFLNLNRRYWLRANNRFHCIIDGTKNVRDSGRLTCFCIKNLLIYHYLLFVIKIWPQTKHSLSMWAVDLTMPEKIERCKINISRQINAVPKYTKFESWFVDYSIWPMLIDDFLQLFKHFVSLGRMIYA